MVRTRARKYSRRSVTRRARVKALREQSVCRMRRLECEREESARLVALYKSQTVLKRRAKEKVRLLSADLAHAKEQHATDADHIDDLRASCEGYIDQIQDREESLCEKDEVIRGLRLKIKQFEAVLPQDWPSNPRLPLGSNSLSLPPAATDAATATAAKEIGDFTLQPPPILRTLVCGSWPAVDGPLFPEFPSPPDVLLSPSGRTFLPGTPAPIGVNRLHRPPHK